MEEDAPPVLALDRPKRQTLIASKRHTMMALAPLEIPGLRIRPAPPSAFRLNPCPKEIPP